MADGHPKYGGSNGVAVLDFGQEGGTRQADGHAIATVRTVVEGDNVRVHEVRLPEINAKFEQIMGYDGTTITMLVTLRADTQTRMDLIERDIESCKGGQVRGSDGTTTTDLTRIRPTLLTNATGQRTWTTARLRDYQRLGPRKTVTSGPWACLQEARLVFVAMR